MGLDANAIEPFCVRLGHQNAKPCLAVVLLHVRRLSEIALGFLAIITTGDLNEFKPKLVSLVCVDHGDLADASLSPSPKERLQKLVPARSIPRK